MPLTAKEARGGKRKEVVRSRAERSRSEQSRGTYRAIDPWNEGVSSGHHIENPCTMYNTNTCVIRSRKSLHTRCNGRASVLILRID